MARPAISVLISVHNGAEFIERCIDSLSRQTFDDFEIVVCNDGSTDSTAEFLENLRPREPRLRTIGNATRRGLAFSLNRCIEAARAPLFARLDADDVSLPHRLERQQAALASDADLVLLGSNVMYVDPIGSPLQASSLPTDDATIRAQSYFCNPFAHPTVIMRRDCLDKAGLRYDPMFETTQDWELWLRVMQCGKVGNLRDILVHQTIHRHSISKTRRGLQLRNSILLQRRQTESMPCRSPSDRQYELLNTGFLDARDQADRNGVDRVEACHIALDLQDLIRQTRPQFLTGPFRHWLLERCVLVGLGLPFRKGIVRLSLRLLVLDPMGFVAAASRVAAAAIVRRRRF